VSLAATIDVGRLQLVFRKAGPLCSTYSRRVSLKTHRSTRQKRKKAPFRGLFRLPSQFLPQLLRVQRVAAVVAGAVRHMRHLLRVAAAIRARMQFVQQPAHRVHHFQVRGLVAGGDLVDPTDYVRHQTLVIFPNIYFY